MSEYVYAMLVRSPGPGAQPRDGLVETEEKECFIPVPGGQSHVWGFASYNRKLTDEETDHYRMFLFGEV